MKSSSCRRDAAQHHRRQLLPAASRGDVLKRVRAGALRLLYVAPERFASTAFLDLLATLAVARDEPVDVWRASRRIDREHHRLDPRRDCRRAHVERSVSRVEPDGARPRLHERAP